MGLIERIQQSLVVDRSGYVVLEHILRWPDNKEPMLGKLGLKEAVAVEAWYIWWQHREPDRFQKEDKLHPQGDQLLLSRQLRGTTRPPLLVQYHMKYNGINQFQSLKNSMLLLVLTFSRMAQAHWRWFFRTIVVRV